MPFDFHSTHNTPPAQHNKKNHTHARTDTTRMEHFQVPMEATGIFDLKGTGGGGVDVSGHCLTQQATIQGNGTVVKRYMTQTEERVLSRFGDPGSGELTTDLWDDAFEFTGGWVFDTKNGAMGLMVDAENGAPVIRWYPTVGYKMVKIVGNVLGVATSGHDTMVFDLTSGHVIVRYTNVLDTGSPAAMVGVDGRLVTARCGYDGHIYVR